MAFTTSGQETEWAYSYSPGAHTGRWRSDKWCALVDINRQDYQVTLALDGDVVKTLSPPTPLRLYTLPYWSNPPCLISDIRALWRSVLSARAPECQKLKMAG